MTIKEQFTNFFKMSKAEKKVICRFYKNLQNGDRVQVYDPATDTIKIGTANRGFYRTNRGTIVQVVRIKVDGDSMAHELVPQAVMAA